MNKVITTRLVMFLMCLGPIFSQASAVELTLVNHTRTTSSGAILPMVTDGSSVTLSNPGSDVAWGWDPVSGTLSSLGVYRAVQHIGGSPFAQSLFMDEVTNLHITSGAVTAVAYSCVEGTFGVDVGVNFCGNYFLGANFVDESTVTYSGLTITRELGGDDEPGDLFPGGLPRSLATAFGSLSLMSDDGSTVVFWNGIPEGEPDSIVMTFEVIEGPAATISIAGGTVQECTSNSSATVDLSADVSGLFGDPLATVEWLLDSASIGFGENLQTVVPLGNHIVEVVVTTGSGETAAAFAGLDIVDTTAPGIVASFTDANGNPITLLPRVDPRSVGLDQVGFSIDVTDACDPAPQVFATAGTEVEDGGSLTVISVLDLVLPLTNSLILRVEASDATGNESVQVSTLSVEPK